MSNDARRSARPAEGPPSGYFIVVPPPGDDAHVDVAAMLRLLGRHWLKLSAACLAAAVIAALISLQLRNVYRSQVVIAPVSKNASSLMQSLGGQVGGLAELVGLDMSAAGGEREQSMAMLNSPGLAREFIVSNKLLTVLFEDEWDAKSKSWKLAAEDVPTVEDGVRRFVGDVRQITEDRRTGIITVRMDWYDRQLASRWANQFIELANSKRRLQAIEDSERSLKYLNQELTKTDVVPVRQAIYKVIESQVNSAMLANVQRDYAFKIIDAAVPADIKRKVAPRRAVITVVSAFMVGLFFAAWLLWRARSQWIIREAVAQRQPGVAAEDDGEMKIE